MKLPVRQPAFWVVAALYWALPSAWANEEKAKPKGPAPSSGRSSSLLAHLEQVAPGVHVAGFSDRHGSANLGWVALKEETLLVDLPRGLPVPAFLKEVAHLAGKPVRKLVLTNLPPGSLPTVESLVEHGIKQIFTSPEIRSRLLGETKKIAPATVKAFSPKMAIGDQTVAVDLVPLDGIVSKGGAIVHLREQQVLFAGPLVLNGPRARLPGTDTARWLGTLRQLEKLKATRVIPGFGSWGGPGVLLRQKHFLAEMRRQVGYFIAQGRPREILLKEVCIPNDYLVWMPYDDPLAEDIEHVYREMTVPAAPFNGRSLPKAGSRPQALVLIGDRWHEPGHLEEGLRPVFEATGVVPHFTVDVRALSAANLSSMQLLVILRDGMQHPQTGPNSEYMWMTPRQQQAVAEFVDKGGAFLNLHNAMGLYPEPGPYLKLAGGKFTTHGPLERFRVEVVDSSHPVTRGVEDFFVADEQHTPWYDAKKVRLLLRNRADDGTVGAAGWVHEPGRGRVCHLANGHTREALLHPMYQRLLRNGVNWCLRRP